MQQDQKQVHNEDTNEDTRRLSTRSATSAPEALQEIPKRNAENRVQPCRIFFEVQIRDPAIGIYSGVNKYLRLFYSQKPEKQRKLPKLPSFILASAHSREKFKIQLIPSKFPKIVNAQQAPEQQSELVSPIYNHFEKPQYH